jgi:hypothetical protein
LNGARRALWSQEFLRHWRQMPLCRVPSLPTGNNIIVTNDQLSHS